MMYFYFEEVCKLFVTAIVILIVSVYVYYKWTTSYWSRKNVESEATFFPFGSAFNIIFQKVQFGQEVSNIYKKCKEKGMRYMGFYIFANPVLIVTDIDLIKSILTKDFPHFTDHGNYINEEGEPLTGMLFMQRGQRWKSLRAKLTPTFTSGKMKMMFQTLLDCSIGLRDVMDEFVLKGEAVDIKDVVARYTTDVIGSCAFGLDCNSLKDPDCDFRKFGKKIFGIGVYEQFVRLLALVSPNLVAFLGLKFLNKEMSDFIMDVVKNTVDYREKHNVLRKDFMHLLIQLKNNVHVNENSDFGHLKLDGGVPTQEGGITLNQIAAQVLIFFVGGFDTSSSALSFCFYELVQNPNVQDRLRDEIKTMLKEHDGNLTYDGLLKMTYMDHCIQETLRKYPPLPLLFRECTENYNIPGSDLVIEKGIQLLIPTLGIHCDPEFYPNPDMFDPDRFSSQNAAQRNHYAWLPFGEGPRICIGMRFGLMQTKVALAVLLSNYEFTLNGKTPTPLVISNKDFITSAKSAILLNVKKLI